MAYIQNLIHYIILVTISYITILLLLNDIALHYFAKTLMLNSNLYELIIDYIKGFAATLYMDDQLRS